MAKKKYVDYEGLRYYNEKLQEIIDAKAGGADVSNQLAALNTKIDNTKQTLETSIGTTNTNLSNLQSSVGVSISALQSKDTQHETAISALQTKDGQHDTAISNLQGKDTTHDTQIASLVNKDTELGTSISALQTKDGQHDSAIANLSSIKADKTEVTREIATAVAGVTQFDYLKVDELPEEGVKGVIYLVLNEQGSEGDIYQEWIWIESEEKFETLGFTNNIDLSNYVTFEDTISNSDIDSLFVKKFGLLFNYLDIKSGSDYSFGINQEVEFPEELWTDDGSYYTPKSDFFKASFTLNETTVEIPYQNVSVNKNNRMLIFNAPQELINLLTQNGGTFVGMTSLIQVNSDIFTLNGVGNKERTLEFVYGDTVDGSAYPFEVLFKYGTHNETFNSPNVGIANENIEFNSEFFNEDEQVYIPKTEDFNVVMKLNETSVTIPNTNCFIDKENHEFYYRVTQELNDLITSNNGSLLGITFDITVPANVITQNGHPSASKHIEFVYGETLDGSEYPSDKVLIDLTSPDTRAEGTWYVISNMKETAQKMEDYYQGGTGEIPVTLKVDNDNTYDLTFASSEEGGPKATENIRYNGTEYKVFTTWDVSDEEVSIILQENE